MLTKYDRTLLSLTMVLPQISRSYLSAANKIAGRFQLSHATAWPLLIMGRTDDGMRPGEIADALGLEAPSVVRVIEQLVETGLMERRDHVSDRRAKTYHLSATGKACAQQLEVALVPFRHQLFANIDQADIETCMRTLARLSVAITAFEAAHALPDMP
jgi:MarR family transcriptional regulator for hemolysin